MVFAELFATLAAYGYIGAFVVSALGTASIFLPVPYYAIIFGMGALPAFDPVLLTIFSALGATVGEFVGYAVGYGGRHFLRKKYKKYFAWGEKWFNRNGFLTIAVFAATPLPDDVIGLIAGSVEYKKSKFFLACFIGKLVLTAIIVFAGMYSLRYVMDYLGW